MKVTIGRSSLAAALTLLIGGVMVACSSPASDRVAALQNYLDLERAAMSDLVGQTSTYTAGEVTGVFIGDPAADEFPGVVVTFTYTYREVVVFGDSSWRDSFHDAVRTEGQTYPLAELEARKAVLVSTCHSSLFPAMRAAGLEGDVQVEYVYLNPGAEGGQSWSASCSSSSP